MARYRNQNKTIEYNGSIWLTQGNHKKKSWRRGSLHLSSYVAFFAWFFLVGVNSIELSCWNRISCGSILRIFMKSRVSWYTTFADERIQRSWMKKQRNKTEQQNNLNLNVDREIKNSTKIWISINIDVSLDVSTWGDWIKID
jgi:hypothetical protein